MKRSAPSSVTSGAEWLRPVPITSAPAQWASWTAVDPTAPPAPWMTTVCPLASFPWSNKPCHAVRPARGTAAAWTWSTVCGFGARLRASTATYSAAAPSRSWSVSPNTSSPTAIPAVPNPSAATTPDTSLPGMTEVRRWPARQVQMGQSSSLCVMPQAATLTSTSQN